MEPGLDPHFHRRVQAPPLRAPQPRAREQTRGRKRKVLHSGKKRKRKHFTHSQSARFRSSPSRPISSPLSSADGESTGAHTLQVSPSPEACGPSSTPARSKNWSRFRGVPHPVRPSTAGLVKTPSIEKDKGFSRSHTFLLEKNDLPCV